MTTRRRPRTGTALAAAAAVLAMPAMGACTGGSDQPAAQRSTSPSSALPTVLPSPSPSASASASIAATLRLARLTRVAIDARYTGRYRVRGPAAGGAGLSRVVVMLAGGRTRILLAAKAGTVAFLSLDGGRYACVLSGPHGPVCYRLAAAGQHLPPNLDPGIPRLFTTVPRALNSHPDRFRIRAADPAVRPAVAGDCFAVTGRAAAARRAVPTGTYCYARSGVLTAALFRSGGLVLADVSAPPPAARITLPASPTPLPSTSG